MTVAEMTRIDRSIEIKAPPERVFRALTNPDELGTWFKVKIEGEIVAGEEVWMTSLFKEGACAGYRFAVKILEVTPPRLFAWRWQPGVPDPKVDYSREPWTTVTFTLEPTAGGGTHLTVAETGFDEVSLERRASVFGDNSKGWAEVLVWLRNYAETAH